MNSKHRKGAALDREQHEQVEYAQRRIRQKKRLYNHFVIFLIGSVFLIGINKILKYGAQYDWFVWAMTLWAFLLVIHVVNVFVTQRFMGQEWERAQREKLVQKQQERMRRLEQEVENAKPLPGPDKKKAP